MTVDDEGSTKKNSRPQRVYDLEDLDPAISILEKEMEKCAYTTPTCYV